MYRILIVEDDHTIAKTVQASKAPGTQITEDYLIWSQWERMCLIL